MCGSEYEHDRSRRCRLKEARDLSASTVKIIQEECTSCLSVLYKDNAPNLCSLARSFLWSRLPGALYDEAICRMEREKSGPNLVILFFRMKG